MTRLAAALALGGLVSLLPAFAWAAAIASGRNWQIAIENLACEGASQLALTLRIDYLGPKGLVETPLTELVDENGKRIAPRSLVWKSGGGRETARWLATGGVADLKTGDIGRFQLRFDVQGTAGELRLEFGDIDAVALTRKGAAPGCDSLLRPERMQTPRTRRGGGGNAHLRIYRDAYACLAPKGALQTIEARYPPSLPKQLLIFGRGYLPSARHIDLPMGRAPAQPYRYGGAGELNAVEAFAKRAIGSDFPQYAGAKYYAFNWGLQTEPSGNKLYSIGLYELQPCPAER